MVTLNEAKHVIAAAEKKALDLLDYIRENVCPRVMLEQLLARERWKAPRMLLAFQ